MKRIKITVITILLLASVMCKGQRVINQYIERYITLAHDLSVEFGVPVSIILGVSILESGSGTSVNCRQLNNFFGVTGKNHLKKRHSDYKQYASPEDSFRDFCNIVSRKNYYPKLKNDISYQKWLVAMNRGSYAGAKGIWISRITSLIKKHRLYLYDKR